MTRRLAQCHRPMCSYLWFGRFNPYRF